MDGASVTIILCLHVLIARRISLILDMLIIFSDNFLILQQNSKFSVEQVVCNENCRLVTTLSNN
jgi:hypothetical protein